MSDNFGEVWNHRLFQDAEPCAEIIPERDLQLGAGFCQPEEGVAAIAPRPASLRVPPLTLRLVT